MFSYDSDTKNKVIHKANIQSQDRLLNAIKSTNSWLDNCPVPATPSFAIGCLQTITNTK